MIKIYTDGSCIGNPGKGGWAAIIIIDGEKKIITGNGMAKKDLVSSFVHQSLNLNEKIKPDDAVGQVTVGHASAVDDQLGKDCWRGGDQFDRHWEFDSRG